MKKIFFSVLAIAAIAACSKSEVQYEQPSEIGFVPVTKMNTKVAVADNKYPEGLELYIFANAGDPSANVSAYTPYFRNGQFKHKAGGVFSGQPTPYYWPNVKKLIFSGYSNSGNVSTTNPRYEYFTGDNSTTPPKPAEWQIKLDAYAPGVGTASEGSNDLMWFPTTRPYAKSDDRGKGEEFPSRVGTDVDEDINVLMKHACAWVTIKMKGDNVTGGTNPWKITNLSILDLAESGNVALGAEAIWTLGADTPVYPFYTTGVELSTDEKDFTRMDINDLIVIPQANKTLRVSYSFVSQAAVGTEGAPGYVPAIVIDEIIDILLPATDNEWVAGKHYTYTITLTAEEILVEPTVNEWQNEPQGIVFPNPGA